MLEQYINKLIDGDKSSMTQIYNITNKSVFAVCLTVCGNFDVAKDLMQDTYISVIKHINSYKRGTNAAAWINSIAHNLSVNYVKKAKWEVGVDVYEQDVGLFGSEVMQLNDESGILALSAKVLNKQELQIVFLHTLGAIALKEVAEMLDLNYSSVRWTYNNSLKKLQRAIKMGGLK